ncbi:MAG TPA: saccharopine dehydrogenase NADP-binding domain-containing protein [Candidatus Methylomirabilis sp.]|nr:saccharopine dehydrogenase NADP-binding domain-containing protein [Candidatus Methylomirabilis sp.]
MSLPQFKTMARTHTFGIVGGYGATGTAAATELLKSSDAQILIGGRDRNRATALATKLGNRVSAAQLDVLDARSLDDFCSRCSIVLNCAGPVLLLQDRVAQAALRSRSHYVDVASLTFVHERMSPRGQEIADQGLSFVISAGWMPGISELVPAYAHAVARTKMDTIESVSVYFSDSGEWSDNALRDAAWFVHQVGLPRPGYFRKGQRTSVKMSTASRIVELGEPIGRRRFSLVSVPELDDLGRRLTDCDVFIYAYLSGFRTAAAAMCMALLPLPDRLGVRLFRNIFRRNRLPVDGFALAQILGQTQGRKCTFTAQVVYRGRRDYWINGLVPATVARLISDGSSVRPGVHYLAAAFDPLLLMSELRKSGVDQSESFEPHT